jgi:tripartite-type tricarboxylate transporter receptor subunit TctC
LVVVAFPAGGGTDIVARLLAPRLSETWGQQVIVDNRAGASGVIGTELAARSDPDGHTLFLGTLGNLAVNQHLYPKMAVDPLRDFAPVTQVVAVHFVMVANPALPAKNAAELIALAKSQPGKINYSSSGPGGAPHLAGELFKSMAGVDIVHIPYKGSAPSFQDLLGGRVSFTCDSLVQALPYVRDGRLKALAVLGRRAPLLPTCRPWRRRCPATSSPTGSAWCSRHRARPSSPGSADVVKAARLWRAEALGMGAMTSATSPPSSAIKADSAEMGKLIREAQSRR